MSLLFELIGVFVMVAILGVLCFILGSINIFVGIGFALFFIWGFYDILKNSGTL